MRDSYYEMKGVAIMDSLDALRATWGFSDDVNDNDISIIEDKAEEIMQRAQKEFDDFLSKRNYEIAMGLIVRVR